MSTEIATVAINDEHDAVYARQRARVIAELLGFDRMDQTRISTAVSGIDFIQTLMPLLSYSFWMAGPENKWDTLLNPHLAPWLTVQNSGQINPFATTQSASAFTVW